MSLETDLVDALDRAAGAHHPAAPDLDALRAGGRRRARRRAATRTGVGVAAVVAVALGITPLLVGRDAGSAPEPAAPLLGELPFGEPPAVPYCPGDRTVVSGDTEVDLPCDVIVTRSGSTLFLGDRRGVVQLHDDGAPVLLDRSRWTHWFPAVSNDGRWAAWITDDGGPARLVVADLVRSDVAATVPWDTSNAWVPGIDDLGRVYTQDFDSADIDFYDIASGEVHEVTGTPDHSATAIRFVTADGLGIRQGNPLGPVLVGRVGHDGQFTAEAESAWDWVHWSPDRSRIVRDTATGLVVSPAAEPEKEVWLDVPEQGSPVWVPVWEDDDHVLVQYDPITPDDGGIVSDSNGVAAPARGTWLLRCAAATGDCEVALEPGWGDGADFPVYR